MSHTQAFKRIIYKHYILENLIYISCLKHVKYLPSSRTSRT
jgi:hypothetical protein